LVISKAAFNLPQFLRLGAFFLAPGGTLIAMKGAEAKEEVKEAVPTATEAGLCLSSSNNLILPVTSNRCTILIYKKVQ
jgi:16S rRNA G527 N7-methylase RsmG